MLEKIKQRLEKGKQKRIAKQREKNIKETIPYIVSSAHFEFATFSYYMARTLLKNKDYVKIGTNRDDFFGHHEQDYYLVKLGPNHFAFKLHKKELEMEKVGRVEKPIGVKSESFEYFDLNNGFFAYRDPKEYQYVQLTGLDLTDRPYDEREIWHGIEDCDGMRFARKGTHTEQEMLVMKQIDSLIDKVEAVCAKHENTATETESV